MTKQEHLIAVAENVFQREQRPAVRLMVGCLVGAAECARHAARTQDRIAALADAAGVPAVNGAECFERVAAMATEVIDVFVKAGFVAADDPILNKPHAAG